MEPESIVWNPESTDFDGSQVSFLVGRVSFASRIHASASDIRDPLFQPRSQGLSSLPPLLLQRRETLGTRLPLFGIRNLMGWDLESEGHLDSFTKGERRANARNVSSQIVVMAGLIRNPLTRSPQLYCVRVTAFSQTDLFLD